MPRRIAISIRKNEDGVFCWSMSSDKCCEAVVNSVEEELGKYDLKVQSKCTASLSNGCRRSTVELKGQGLQRHQEIVGVSQ